MLQFNIQQLMKVKLSKLSFVFLHGNNHLQQMGLCEENRILIKNVYEFKSYGAKRMMKKFPTK